MTNELMLNNFINRVNAIAYTHLYIFGYTDRGNVYASYVTSDLLPYICCVDKTSSKRSGEFSLRFKPTINQKELLKMQESFVLCSESYLENLFANSKYNRGEIFEKLITEYYGQVWEKGNVPFTKDGDITVDGAAYQIKYQKATFCTESSLANLEADAIINK